MFHYQVNIENYSNYCWVTNISTGKDDYAKNGGPWEVGLSCSFYHEPLHIWMKTTAILHVNKSFKLIK